MGLHWVNKGDYGKTRKFLLKNTTGTRRFILERYGAIGVDMLREATPIDSGVTANSWFYQIVDSPERSSLYFCNSSNNEGVPIAIILQYGHGTGTGGWVEGRDYINPALKPVFESLADSMWKEVTSD